MQVMNNNNVINKALALGLNWLRRRPMLSGDSFSVLSGDNDK
jgi:hypothetical protein